MMSRLHELCEELGHLGDEDYDTLRNELCESAADDLQFAFELQTDAVRVLVLILVKQLSAEQQEGSGVKLLVAVLNNDIEALKIFAGISFDKLRAGQIGPSSPMAPSSKASS